MNDKDKKYIEIGRCSKPHGIKGGFSFHLINKDESILKKGLPIRITPLEGSSISPDGDIVEIQSISFGPKSIAYLKGIQNRNQVEQMVPFKIWVDRELFPPEEEGEFYLSDLPGLKVLNESNDELLGTVIGTYDNGAQDVLVIESENGRKTEILFIENFVKEVNLDDEVIKVLVPEII
jgi:16S rRNA processing protein RimM